MSRTFKASYWVEFLRGHLIFPVKFFYITYFSMFRLFLPCCFINFFFLHFLFSCLSGLILKHGKKYSQTVRKAFHVSAASLDTTTTKSSDDIQVLLTSDDNVYILCTLNKVNDKQRPLDLNFAEGDKISFAIKGEGIVHLTGFLIPDADDEFMDMSDEEEENVVDSKKKGQSAEKGGKKNDKKMEKNPLLKLVAGDDDSDSDELDESFDPTKPADEVRKGKLGL